MSRIITRLHLFVINPKARRGLLVAGHLRLPCLLGNSGLTTRKREGDGATPRGKFKLLWHYQRGRRITATISQRPLNQNSGWCDASNHPSYNRPVTLPFKASHEKLYRNDSAYDVVIVMDFNMHPRQRGKGSAIFFHLIREGAQFTEGCIAISKSDMRKLLPLLGPKTQIYTE